MFIPVCTVTTRHLFDCNCILYTASSGRTWDRLELRKYLNETLPLGEASGLAQGAPMRETIWLFHIVLLNYPLFQILNKRFLVNSGCEKCLDRRDTEIHHALWLRPGNLIRNPGVEASERSRSYRCDRRLSSLALIFSGRCFSTLNRHLLEALAESFLAFRFDDPPGFLAKRVGCSVGACSQLTDY